MIKYHINPRIRKRWFKQNELVYDLVKYSEKEGERYSPYEGGAQIIKTEETIFTSKDLDEVITLKDNLQKTNNDGN